MLSIVENQVHAQSITNTYPVLTDVKKHISFKVGCNFDTNLVLGLKKLNEKYHDKPWEITELYGSVPSVNEIGTARPDWRLHNISRESLVDFSRVAALNGFRINYTLNTSFVDPRALNARMDRIRSFLAHLQSRLNVIRVTVAHPLVAQIVQENSDLPIELSTILQISHPRQLEEFKRRCPRVEKLCIDVFANRDRVLLDELRACGNALGITLEVITNEFCVASCCDRNSCYDLHALNLSEEAVKLFKRYPMGLCVGQRIRDPREWLFARFILPQWVEQYHKTFNIESFKITGRTHPTPYILKTVEHYMSGSYSGNLLELWADVEHLGKIESEHRAPRVNLDCSKLSDDFLKFYFETDVRPSSAAEKSYIDRVFEAINVK